MRFLVLLANSIVVTGAFVALKEALRDAGEGLYSTLGFAAGMTSGAAYLLSISLTVGVSAARVGKGHAPEVGDLISGFYDILEFVACVMTYLATLAFAVSLGQAGWLGRIAVRAYLTASSVMVLFLMLRGVSYPEISANTAPWYTQPGVIAGIPAIPWIMPCLLGVVLLRRAGDGDEVTKAA
jgi:hypothetical protein